MVSTETLPRHRHTDTALGLVEISNSKATKLDDFSALQKEVAAASPKGVTMDNYSPANKAASCPSVDSSWGANSTLPPTPNSDTCDCILKSSECVPVSDLDTDDYSEIFDYICGEDESLCSGINGNSTTGVYGTYSMCGDEDKLAYVLNAYYKDQKKASTACDFDGKAKTQKASGDSCADSSSGSSGGNGSSSDDGDDSAAVLGASMRVFRVLGLDIGVYVVVAGVSVGMTLF